MRNKSLRIVCAALALVLTTTLFSQSAPRSSATIEWEPVNGAGGYLVELRKGSELIINQKTQATSFTLDPSMLEPGTYKLRISTLDRNQDVASNSPWIDLHVRQRGQSARKYVYIAGGWSYNFLLQNWNKIVKDSPLNFHLYGGYDWFSPYGFDLILDVAHFEKSSKTDVVFESITTYSVIPGAYYLLPIDEHFNFFARAGLGIAVSNLDIRNNGTTKSYLSTDLMFVPSVGLRSSYQSFFADTGVEFETIFYSSSPFFSVKPYIRIGMKF